MSRLLQRYIEFGERIKAENEEYASSLRYSLGQGEEGYKRYCEEKRWAEFSAKINRLGKDISRMFATVAPAFQVMARSINDAAIDAMRYITMSFVIPPDVLEKKESSHISAYRSGRVRYK